MENRFSDINDDEVVFLGGKLTEATGSRRRWRIASAVIVIAVAVAIVLWRITPSGDETVQDVFEPVVEQPSLTEVEPFPALDTVSYVETRWMTVNDIPLTVFIPHACRARLAMGEPDERDSRILLSLQAADIRADNRRINGAFVLKGRPLAWGLSKRGYVAIIRDTIFVGTADNSPLFEEATETDGYFFRQYALVDEGRIVENALKTKSIRKAVCSRAGQTIVVVTETRESMHDFSQALVDMGVRNAVYLVGSEYATGFIRERDGSIATFVEPSYRGHYRFENHIQWVRTDSGQ